MTNDLLILSSRLSVLLCIQLLEEGEDVVPPAAEAKEGESKMDVSGDYPTPGPIFIYNP